MRLSLLCLGLVALLATTAQAQVPAELHTQPYPTDYSYVLKNINEPPVPVMISRAPKGANTQGLTYKRLWISDFYPLFETFTANKVFQYDDQTGTVFLVENSRVFTNNALTGGMMAVWSSGDNFVNDSNVTEVFNRNGTVLSMPNFATTNSGSDNVDDLQWSILGFTYDEINGWSRTSQAGIFKTSGEPFDFPMDGPESNNNQGYTWNYGDVVGVNGSAPSTYFVGQLGNNNGSGQFGAYGTWGFDFDFEDFLSSTIPSAWDVNQFRNPNNINSTFNGQPRIGADADGKLYMVVNNIFADDDQNRVPAVSKSEDQGINWSAFSRMPVSVLDAYATTNGWANIIVYRPYDMEGLVVTGSEQFSYFFRVAQTDAQGQLMNLDLVEAVYDNGSWTMNRVAELNGIPLQFQRQDSISALQGETAYVPSYDVNSQGHEIEAALAADGSGIVVKWIDENPDLGYVQFDNTQSAYFFSQQSGQWVESQFDSLLTTDVYYRIKRNGNWENVINITEDMDYDHGTRIPPVIPSVDEIPFMSLKTITKGEYNPAYPFLPAINQLPDLILDASVDFRTPNNVQYALISATTSVEEETEEMNFTFTFNNVVPNPAVNEAEVTFTMDVPGLVNVEVFSTTGNKVANVYTGNMTAGIHGLMVDASSMASGTYYVALTVNGNRVTKPLVIVK